MKEKVELFWCYDPWGYGFGPKANTAIKVKSYSDWRKWTSNERDLLLIHKDAPLRKNEISNNTKYFVHHDNGYSIGPVVNGFVDALDLEDCNMPYKMTIEEVLNKWGSLDCVSFHKDAPILYNDDLRYYFEES